MRINNRGKTDLLRTWLPMQSREGDFRFGSEADIRPCSRRAGPFTGRASPTIQISKNKAEAHLRRPQGESRLGDDEKLL